MTVGAYYVSQTHYGVLLVKLLAIVQGSNSCKLEIVHSRFSDNYSINGALLYLHHKHLLYKLTDLEKELLL